MVFVVDILVPALATIVTGLVGWGLAVLVNWLNSKIKNENLKKGLENVYDIISGSVALVSQTYVDDLKKTGKFDEAAKGEAMKKALELVHTQLTTETSNIINNVTNDIDGWLTAQIEKNIRETKK